LFSAITPTFEICGLSEPARDFEIVWLQEIERRLSEGLALDYREMMVALRGELPRGFKPSDVDRRFLYGTGPSVAGFQAVGDRAHLLPDIERTICHIRDRLIGDPSLPQISASEISDALELPLKRAERVLGLMSSLGHFYSAVVGSDDGYSQITLGRDDVVAAYLGFDSLSGLLTQTFEQRPGSLHKFRSL
jgi:hypothetical protein